MTLLERGAIALATEYGLAWDDIPDEPTFKGGHDLSCKAFWREMSKAYLEGIRDPTDDMVALGESAMDLVHPDHNTPEERRIEFKTGWGVAIDAALKETPK